MSTEIKPPSDLSSAFQEIARAIDGAEKEVESGQQLEKLSQIWNRLEELTEQVQAQFRLLTPNIVERQVISEPDAAIKVTELILSKEAKQGLTTTLTKLGFVR